MNGEGTPRDPAAFDPAKSSFAGPIAELVAQRVLSPPARPGLLANLGRFEIFRLVGSGGMGVVFSAAIPPLDPRSRSSSSNRSYWAMRRSSTAF